jgi:hypothetical protein
MERHWLSVLRTSAANVGAVFAAFLPDLSRREPHRTDWAPWRRITSRRPGNGSKVNNHPIEKIDPITALTAKFVGS